MFLNPEEGMVKIRYRIPRINIRLRMFTWWAGSEYLSLKLEVAPGSPFPSACRRIAGKRLLRFD